MTLMSILVLSGCDRYIKQTVRLQSTLELRGATAGSLSEVEIDDALNIVRAVALERNFYSVPVPETLKSMHARAVFDTNSDITTPRGKWLYFVVQVPPDKRTLDVVFHQFPNLSPTPEMRAVEEQLQQKLGERFGRNRIQLCLAAKDCGPDLAF